VPVSFLAFDQPGWTPDGGEHGPGLSVAENLLPVNGSYRLIQTKVPQASLADGPVTGAIVHVFQQARTVQYARPSADTSPGNFESQPTPGQPLFSQINEGTPNDAAYILIPNAPSAQSATLALSAIGPPGLTSGHVIQFRYAIPATSGTWSIVFALLQQPAGTVIATRTVTAGTAQPGFLLASFGLTTGEAAAITDYTKLALKWTVTVPGAQQLIYPAADTSIGGWLGQPGSLTTNLWQILATFPVVTSPAIVSKPLAVGASDTYTAAIGAGAVDPITRAGHVLNAELAASNAGVTMVLTIFQGATVVAQLTAANVPTAPTAFSVAVPRATAAGITDYTQLTCSIVASYPADVPSTVAQTAGTPTGTVGSTAALSFALQCAPPPTSPTNAVAVLADGSDATYLYSQAAGALNFSVLSPSVPALSPTGYRLLVRALGNGVTNLAVSLLSYTGSLITSFTIAPTSSVAPYTYTLAPSEAAAVDALIPAGQPFQMTLSYAGAGVQVMRMEFDAAVPRGGVCSSLQLDVPSASAAAISWADYEAPDPMTSYKGDVPTIYAGTPTKLYTAGQAWANVSRSGGYAAGTAHAAGWRFLQVGPDVYATNYVDPIQARLAGAGLFGPLITDPTPAPQARFMALVRQYMVLADINLTGYGPDWLWWSAAGNPASLTPSFTTQAGNGFIRSRPGQIMGLVGGDNGVIFKRNSTHSLTWTGDQNVFRVDEVSRSVGTPFPSSVVQADGYIYWWGGSCFWVTDGTALPQRVGDQVVSNYISDTIISPGAIQPYDPPDMASEDQMMIGSYDPETGLIRWTYMALGDQPWRHSRAVLYSPKEDRWAAIRLPGANFAFHARQQNSITNETLYEHGTVGFDWDGTTTTWYKFSGSGTYVATISTQIRPIGLDKADMPIGARTRGYSYVPNPQQDYPIRARLREIFPMWSETPALGPPNSSLGTPMTLTVEVSEDPLCRPTSGSYRKLTYSNLIANERFTFPTDDLEGFWWRYSFTLGPLASARMIYAFRGAWISWEPRSRG
jgi:hypothetical protein